MNISIGTVIDIKYGVGVDKPIRFIGDATVLSSDPQKTYKVSVAEGSHFYIPGIQNHEEYRITEIASNKIKLVSRTEPAEIYIYTMVEAGI